MLLSIEDVSLWHSTVEIIYLALLTIGDVMPKSGIQGVVCSPSADVCPIGFARVILVRESRTKLRLRVESRKRINVGFPAGKKFSPRDAEMRYDITHV